MQATAILSESAILALSANRTIMRQLSWHSSEMSIVVQSVRDSAFVTGGDPTGWRVPASSAFR